ncbi:MAG: hypothetical protein J6A15_07040 [Clostridia bacterium]|nr:hypothetical protein [Clostridia bacterium]
MKKVLKTLIICIVLGTGITFGVLHLADGYLYKLTQSSYLEVETYRTNNQAEIKSTDLISIPENAEQLQFSYNNKYYAYLEDGSIHINTTEDKAEYHVIKEENPICYYYILYDKNLMIYFIEDESGSYTTLSLRTFEMTTKRTTEYNDISVYNFSKVKDITFSPLVNIFYINIETKTGVTTNNVVYRIDLFNSITRVRSGSILNKIRMLQHTDKLYYEDTDGGVYSSGASVNYLFNYADVELIGIDSKLASADDVEKLYLLNTETYDRVYVVGGGRLLDTIMLSDTDVVTSYNEYNDVYLIYPTYILNLSGENPYKRVAKLSKYVTFEAIKGDTVYLRTSNNKIITTTLLDN